MCKVLGPGRTATIDERVTRLKIMMQTFGDAFPLLLAREVDKVELDVRATALRSFAETLYQIGDVSGDDGENPWEVIDMPGLVIHVKNILKAALSSKIVSTTMAYSLFVLEFNTFSSTGNEDGSITEGQQAKEFVEKSIARAAVGDVTEMLAVNRLDTLFQPYLLFMSLDWNMTDLKMKSVSVNSIVLGQPVLHLSQHMVHCSKLGNDIVTSDQKCKTLVSSLVDMRQGGQFKGVAMEIVDALHRCPDEPCPVTLRRARRVIKLVPETVGQSASNIIQHFVAGFDSALKETLDKKNSIVIVRINELCAEGDFTDERAKVLFDLVISDTAQQYYQGYKLLKKVMAVAETIAKHTVLVSEILDVKSASTAEKANIEKKDIFTHVGHQRRAGQREASGHGATARRMDC